MFGPIPPCCFNKSRCFAGFACTFGAGLYPCDKRNMASWQHVSGLKKRNSQKPMLHHSWKIKNNNKKKKKKSIVFFLLAKPMPHHSECHCSYHLFKHPSWKLKSRTSICWGQVRLVAFCPSKKLPRLKISQKYWDHLFLPSDWYNRFIHQRSQGRAVDGFHWIRLFAESSITKFKLFVSLPVSFHKMKGQPTVPKTSKFVHARCS